MSSRQYLRNWYQLYQTIRPKIDEHQGKESLYALILEQANTTGHDKSVIKRMLNAGYFLDRIAPQHLHTDRVKCGYSNIELLERLYKLDPELANTYLDDVLANTLPLKELRQLLDSYSSKPGSAQVNVRSLARQRVADHHRLALELIKREGGGFFGADQGEPILVKAFRTLRNFVLINDPAKPIIVLPRVGNSAAKEEKEASEIINLAVSIRAYVYRVWLVLPSDSPLLLEIASQAHRLGIFGQWLFIATPNEDASGLELYRNLAGALAADLEGDDLLRWQGISLVDGGKKHGSFSVRQSDT